jgi:hypothetical protein
MLSSVVAIDVHLINGFNFIFIKWIYEFLVLRCSVICHWHVCSNILVSQLLLLLLSKGNLQRILLIHSLREWWILLESLQVLRVTIEVHRVWTISPSVHLMSHTQRRSKLTDTALAQITVACLSKRALGIEGWLR